MVVQRFKKAQAESKLRPCTTKTASTTQFVHGGSLNPGDEGTATPHNVAYPALARTPSKVVLSKATDWKIQFDLNAPDLKQSKEVKFPEEIGVITGQRPDGLIWSNAEKIMIWIELTSPWEELADQRHFEKKARYNQLSIDMRNMGWKVHELAVEVGCRGHVGAEGWHSMYSTLGFSKAEAERMKESVKETAMHCSHSLFVHRCVLEWKEKPLLDVERWYQ